MKLNRRIEHCASTEKLCQIRAEVRQACQQMHFCQEDINLITLAIDEACTNIIRYAYSGDESGRLIVSIFHNESDAIFHLQDFAKCISPSCLEVRKKNLTEPGGLGLQLIHQVMDQVQLLPPSSSIGNILELKKHLPLL
ncbi:MAG: ATP-binding protein [Alteromonadaceae bacterium]|nr:ATP-binding protein [Alteromonadaceae bacterium]